jgi:hypothetical protein
MAEAPCQTIAYNEATVVLVTISARASCSPSPSQLERGVEDIGGL